MSISIVDFQNGHNEISEVGLYLKRYIADAVRFREDFTAVVLEALLDSDPSYEFGLTPEIESKIKHELNISSGTLGLHQVGRCGVRELTSDWAQDKYPLASYEIVLTLTPARHEPLVFLVYV